MLTLHQSEIGIRRVKRRLTCHVALDDCCITIVALAVAVHVAVARHGQKLGTPSLTRREPVYTTLDERPVRVGDVPRAVHITALARVADAIPLGCVEAAIVLLVRVRRVRTVVHVIRNAVPVRVPYARTKLPVPTELGPAVR